MPTLSPLTLRFEPTPAKASVPADKLFRWALAIWFVIALVITSKCVLKPNTHTVYTTYSQAAKTWFEFETPRRYGISYLQRQYCPFFGVLMQPFAALPDSVGGAAWSLLGLVLIGTGFLRLLRRMARADLIANRGVAMLCLPMFGIASIFNGQANMLMLGCMLWGTVFTLERSYWRAGLFLAIPIAIKTYPIALAMVLIGLAPRLFVPLATALAALFLSPFLFCTRAIGFELYSQWVGFLVSHEHLNTSFITADFQAFLLHWDLGLGRTAHLLLQAATGALIFATALWIRWRNEPANPIGSLQAGRGFREQRTWNRQSARSQIAAITWGYLLTSMWFVAFGPATEEATYLLAAPALAIVGERNLVGWKTSPIRFWFMAMLLTFIGPTQASILGEITRKWVFEQKLAPFSLALVFAYCIVIQWRASEQSSSQIPQKELDLSILGEEQLLPEPEILAGHFRNREKPSQRKAA